MELTLQEKLKLIKFFEFLLDEEISKPLGQMNSEAVDNYIKILLHLKDINIELSSEFINEQVRKIFHPEETAVPETAKTTKKHFNKRKIWLVAACIAILVALFSIVSFSSEKGVVDTLEEFFGTFEFIPFGKEMDLGNETYGKEGKSKHYKSLEDAVEKEKLNILCPSSNLVTTKRFTVSSSKEGQYFYLMFDDPNLFMTISINSELTDEIIGFCNETITLNDIKYHLCIMDDTSSVQAYFVYENNLYDITYTNKESLIEILKSMEEIKYED